MPLTFAHPAVVIPFKYLPRRYYSWTGLIVGSIVPDFEAFIKLGGEKQFSHSWLGMFVFDLPLGLLLAFLFHFIVRDALLHHLPSFLTSRFCTKTINWSAIFRANFPVIILSLLVGITSHLIWDRITHTDTYTYHEKAGIRIAPDVETTLRQWLQWTNSIGGVLIIVWQLYLRPKFSSFRQQPWKFYWVLVCIVPIMFLLVRVNFPTQGDDLINTALAGLLTGILIASAIFRKKQRAAVCSGSS